MSSLQKFHRRTNGGSAPILIGSGSDTMGYYLGTAGDAISKMYVAPKSTDVVLTWGSKGTVRGITDKNDGLANTNTLYAFGQAAHPAAYYCKTLTAGGYNTWYMPALNELITCNTSRLATPFATSNSFYTTSGTTVYRSSSELNGDYAFTWNFNFNDMSSGQNNPGSDKNPGTFGTYRVRAVRRAP